MFRGHLVSHYSLILPICSALTLTACPGDDSPADPSTSTADGTADGATVADDTSDDAPMPFCGDGTVDVDEECDDGEANADNAACTAGCMVAVCGDGLVLEGTEVCDDGNDVDDDGCTNACELPADPMCGDGTVDPNEECDEGKDNGPDGTCLEDCTLAGVCGDGRVSGGEQCDDGNDDNNDACTELCAPPTCGDGFAQTVNSELCDDGDDQEGDECNADCTTAGLWTDTFNGAADNNDSVYGVAADSNGNVIAVGEVFDAAQGDNVWVRKYSPDGSIQWTEVFHGGITADVANAVAVNDADDIFVAGSSFTLDDGTDTWLRRYSPDGTPQWTRTFNGGANDADAALGVAVDGAGNVVVAGFITTPTAERDIWVRKYNAGGTTQWSDTIGGAGGQDDEAHGVAVDGDGNVLVTGYVWAGSDARDIWVRKYDPNGTPLWTQTYGGASGDNDEGNGIAADSAGNVIVAGYETTAGVGRDIWVRKYDASGGELWTRTYNAPQDGSDRGRAVVVDGDDQIIVAASVFRGTQSDNVWVRKYTADGDEVWTSTYNSDGFGSDVANSVAVDPEGNIAVGGYETRTDLSEFRNTWVRRILQ